MASCPSDFQNKANICSFDRVTLQFLYNLCKWIKSAFPICFRTNIYTNGLQSSYCAQINATVCDIEALLSPYLPNVVNSGFVRIASAEVESQHGFNLLTQYDREPMQICKEISRIIGVENILTMRPSTYLQRKQIPLILYFNHYGNAEVRALFDRLIDICEKDGCFPHLNIRGPPLPPSGVKDINLPSFEIMSLLVLLPFDKCMNVYINICATAAETTQQQQQPSSSSSGDVDDDNMLWSTKGIIQEAYMGVNMQSENAPGSAMWNLKLYLQKMHSGNQRLQRNEATMLNWITTSPIYLSAPQLDIQLDALFDKSSSWNPPIENMFDWLPPDQVDFLINVAENSFLK